MQTSAASYREMLNRRLARPVGGFMHAMTKLRHFALITYALPKARLEPHIPSDRFEIPEFTIGGQKFALLSFVPFLDVDFHFPRIIPSRKFSFAQTNHRAYVIDRQTGEHGVWFFGTTLGSYLVHIPRTLWKLPWHFARYNVDCRYSETDRQYERFHYQMDSQWCSGHVEIEDTGEEVRDVEGFASYDEMKFILTQPVTGWFRRLDGRIGTYSIWHEEMRMTLGHVREARFSLYENLGIFSKEEMTKPHSVLICPEIEFRILLPPRIDEPKAA